MADRLPLKTAEMPQKLACQALLFTGIRSDPQLRDSGTAKSPSASSSVAVTVCVSAAMRVSRSVMRFSSVLIWAAVLCHTSSATVPCRKKLTLAGRCRFQQKPRPRLLARRALLLVQQGFQHFNGLIRQRDAILMAGMAVSTELAIQRLKQLPCQLSVRFRVTYC